MDPSGGLAPLFDEARQPARTSLAWQRAALAMGGGSIGAAHALSGILGGCAVLPATVGLTVSVAIFVLAHRRHRTAHDRLAENPADAPLHSGVLPALTAGFIFAAGAVALIIVLVS